MKPEQVLDMQADLHQRLSSGPDRFRAYILGVLDQASLPLKSEEARSKVRRSLGLALARSVQMSLAYRVTDDLSMLVQHAASTLDETDVFSPDLGPSEYGFVFFEKPLPIRDVRGKTLLAHWLIWGRVVVDIQGVQTPATAAYWFNDHHLQPDEMARELLSDYGPKRIEEVQGRWGFVGADVFLSGWQVGEPFEEVSDFQRAQIIAEGDEPMPFTNTMRYLHALWMLLGQSVTTTEDEYVRKTAFKRAQRLGLIARVTVIRLRRSEGNRHEGESLIDWSHRWLVRGHPRWQPYGERSVDHDHALGPVVVENGHSVKHCQISGCDHEVRRIWIAPYVKGPEGKPLRFTDHVYDLAR